MASSSAPDAAPPLLVRIRGLRPSLSPAEDRVAEQVLADPRAASALTISELAVTASTSETTVLRFCKRLGLRGYPQLRLALAEAGTGQRVSEAPTTDISADDTVDDVITKVAFADASAVEETAQTIDRGALSATAAAIAAAGRVDVYGIGASALVGMDLQQKLHRIGSVVFAWNDPHIALTSATLLGPGDVAIGVSHSGTTTETVEALALAKQPRRDDGRHHELPRLTAGGRGGLRPRDGRPRVEPALRCHGEPHRGPHGRGLPVHRRRPARPVQGGVRGREHPAGGRRAPRALLIHVIDDGGVGK